MRLIAILPVFNEAANLPRCLRSLAAFVDGIVALDDGSTDNSRAILSACPTVLEVIKRDASEKGSWNDADNHTRLNSALEKYQPEWVLRIDADESFDDSMGVHVRTLMDSPPGMKVFGFRRHLYDENLRTMSTNSISLLRLYRYDPASTFAQRRLHFSFEPTQFARDEKFLTNIRLWHHTDYTEDLRRQRYNKYLKEDSRNEFQDSYENLLRPATFVAAPEPCTTLEIGPFHPPKKSFLAGLLAFIRKPR